MGFDWQVCETVAMKPRRPSVKDTFGAHRRNRTKRLAEAKAKIDAVAKKKASRDDLGLMAARIMKNVTSDVEKKDLPEDLS